MAQRPLDWEAIKTVTQVARQRTVRGAAAVLGVHHTTVGRRIEQLEQQLGVRLFDRLPDGYAITPDGVELVALGARFADELVDVRRRIGGRDDGLTGSVTVTVPEPLFEAVIAPRLPAFVDAHPDVTLRFELGLDFVNMARHEADVAIRLSNDPPDTLVGKRLFAYRQCAYATPTYLVAMAAPDHERSARWLGWDDDERAHPDWARDTAFPDLPVWGAFPSIAAQRAAAAAGLGLALLPCLFGDADARLVRAGDRAPDARRDIWVLTHSDLRRVARVRAVMRFAEDVLRDVRAAIEGTG